MDWISLHNHSMYSVLDSGAKPDKIAQRAKELNMKAFAFTDHGNMSVAVKMHKELNKVSIKPISGVEYYLCKQDASIKKPENRSCSHLVVLAKNHDGWKNLIKATSASNRPECFYYKPRLDLKKLSDFSNGKFITFSGHPGSDLGNIIWTNPKLGYSSQSIEEARKYLKGNAIEEATKLSYEYMDLFGKENFYLEIQLIDKDRMPAAQLIADVLRQIGKKEGIPCVATADSHYIYREDAEDQRILLCSRFETNLSEIKRKIDSGDDTDLMGFFKSDKYYIPSIEEMCELHKEFPEELENSVKIADTCEHYKILNKPEIPTFGDNPEEQLVEMCRKGWYQKIQGKISKDNEQIYVDRVKNELNVLNGAGLAPYFLIVQDYIQASVNRGELCMVRGSGTGCMVSYLIGISDVDPIKYDLLFERFYNAGRNTKDNISLPDIDCDFETDKRELTIQYIENKYGSDKVSQVATFGRMQGRAAIKDVLRAHSVCDYDEMNSITEYIPDESKIADDLQLMREAGEEPSIIHWSLENNEKHLREWCYIDDNGNYSGPLAKYFEQARRLEGSKRSMGKHAAAIVISKNPIAEMCPMIYDKGTGKMICGMEYTDMELMGIPKFDILGVSCLDKLSGVKKLLATGRI